MHREDCSLLRDDWQALFREMQASQSLTPLYQLLRVFTRIPTLVKLMRTWKTYDFSGLRASDPVNMYAQFIKRELDDVVTNMIQSRRSQNSSRHHQDLSYEDLPSSEVNDDDYLFLHAFHFRTREGAIFHTWYWTALLIVDICKARLSSSSSNDSDASRHQSEDTPTPAVAAATKICMSYSDATALIPLGAQFIQFPLICAYHVSSEKVKQLDDTAEVILGE